MVVLSKNHEAIIASVDSSLVASNFKTLGELEVFFHSHLEEMEALAIDKKMYTGPLYEMTNCNKYYGRVAGSFADEVDPAYNTGQLLSLLRDLKNGTMDSATAVQYYNQEAMALHSADRTINKSYGACYSCLRRQDDLVKTLDSLKGFILAPHAEP
jgi:hypothetical protein